MGKNRASGSGGFTVEFFIKLWDMIKDNFSSLFIEFYENGRLNACIKENIICLIKEKEDAIKVRDFRPISLTTLLYKLIAKVLAERWKLFMPSIIAPSWSAFLEGQQILDPILIANEIVEEYRPTKKQGWIIKVDLEKVFDRVDCGLEKVMHQIFFDHKWLNWVMGCVKNPMYSVFINRRLRGRIHASRGLRQGDLL